MTLSPAEQDLTRPDKTRSALTMTVAAAGRGHCMAITHTHAHTHTHAILTSFSTQGSCCCPLPARPFTCWPNGGNVWWRK